MNKLTITIVIICFTILSFGQSNENSKLIELGKAYKDFMFRNDPPKDIIKDLKQGLSERMKVTGNFIIQTITTDNKLLTKPFLTLPDSSSLKSIYIVWAINVNLRAEERLDNNKLIDSLKNTNVPRYELVDNYYDLLFTAVGNKIKPFDFSKVDFKLKEYNLIDETEKGIFFLECMNYCGRTIWGYINVAKPMNTKKAYEFIGNFPKFNGQPYYQFNDLYFSDFEMTIDLKKGPQSYKSFYIDRYYETLLIHLTCITKENGTEKERNDLLLGSILKDKNLYKFSKKKDILEGLFTEVKKD